MNESKELPQPKGIETREVGIIPAIARVCHEANRAWCVAMGDHSQVSWDEAPEWQRQSAVTGVRAALNGAGPEELHASWMEEKRRDGWVYGPVKNASTKEHPCMVPYDKLPIEQRRKDHLFRAVVAALTVPVTGV